MVNQLKVTGELYFNVHQPQLIMQISSVMQPISLQERRCSTTQSQAITNLGSPIAQISAINSSVAAASAKSDNAGGLEAAIFMAEGA